MARSNIPMVINLRQNKNDDSTAYGKYFAEVDSKEPLNLKGFAKHMTSHGKIADYQMCVLVLGQVVECMSELLAQGQPVKLDNLAIFKASVVSTPADDVESFELDSNVKSLKLLAIATGRLTRKMLTQDALLGYTSLAERVRKGEIALSDKKGEYIATEDTGNDPVVNP